MKTTKFFTLILLLISVQLLSQDRIKIDGVVAVVGKHIVLQSDIEKFKFELEQSGESADFSECKVMERIMQQKLLAHHAEVDSIIVTDADVLSTVNKKIDYFEEQLGGQDQILAFYGFSNIDDLKEELIRIEKEQSMIGQMQQKITSDVNITPDEVRNYFNSLKETDNLPEFPTEVELSQIVLYIEPSEEEIQRVISELNVLKKEIEDGANMKLKALLSSEDPGVAQNGGLYSLTRKDGFVKEFKDAAFSLDEGQVSEPFKSMFGYHIVKVEKVRGQTLDVRHILIRPKVSELEKLKVEMRLDSIRNEINAGNLTFEDAVAKFSEDTESNKNKGVIINPYTQESTFKLSGEILMQAFPSLHSKVYNLEQGEMTEVYYDEDREGTQMYKLVRITEKNEGHQADFSKDYVKIQNLALSKKKNEVLEEWISEHVKDTYIKINDEYKDCDFEINYLKK